MEVVLVYYGYDCRGKFQATLTPQLGSAGVGFAVQFARAPKCIDCLIIITQVLSWRITSPRQCDPSAWAGETCW